MNITLQITPAVQAELARQAAVAGRALEIHAATLLEEAVHLPVEESIDWTKCPLVEINPRKVSGTPILKGSRMPADAIVENYRGGLPADEIADVFELPVESVRALLRYVEQRHSGF